LSDVGYPHMGGLLESDVDVTTLAHGDDRGFVSW
jgi:hypothetical protein